MGLVVYGHRRKGDCDDVEQLECIAEATGAGYYSAKDAGEFRLAAEEVTTAAPGETIAVHFEAPAVLGSKAWIGVIPSNIPHGSENENDRHDVSYQYLRGQTSGTLKFASTVSVAVFDTVTSELSTYTCVGVFHSAVVMLPFDCTMPLLSPRNPPPWAMSMTCQLLFGSFASNISASSTM